MGRQKTRQNQTIQPQQVAVTLEGQPSASRTPTSPARTIQPIKAHIDASRPIASTALGLHGRRASIEDYESDRGSNGSESPLGRCDRDRRSPDKPLGQMLLSPLGAMPPDIHPEQPPGLGRESHTPRLGSAQWPESQHISVPSTPMSEGARGRRREEKRALKELPRVEDEEEGDDMASYLEVVNHICELHCWDAAGFDAASLQRQLKELSSKFLNRHQLMPTQAQVSPSAHSPSRIQMEMNPLRKESPDQREDSSSRRGTPRREGGGLPSPVPPKKKVHYDAVNRVALQRFRNGEIREGMHTNLPDQGIRFDKDGRPWDKYDSPSRNSRRETNSSGPTRKPAQSHAGAKGGPGGDDSDEHISSSDGSNDRDGTKYISSSGEEDGSIQHSR